jgi:hypothetical protein
MAIQTARELTFALRNPAPAAPFARLGYQQHEAFARVTNIFKEIAAPEPSGKETMTTAKSVQAPIPSIPHTEVPVSIPSLLKQPPLHTSKGGRRRSKGGGSLSKGEPDSNKDNDAGDNKLASYAR